MAKMDDDRLRTVIESEIQVSTLMDDDYQSAIEKADQYYNGSPRDDEIKGRSGFVSWDVFEVVESALPEFIEPFFSGDNIGAYTPRKPSDEPFADQATDYANLIIKDDNDGFEIFTQWIKGALLYPLSAVRAEWVKEDPERKELESIPFEQVAMLAQQPDVQIIEHSAIPPEIVDGQMVKPELHSITYTEQRPGLVKIEHVDPRNFIITVSKSRKQARLMGELVSYTRSDLKEMGYDVPAEFGSFDGAFTEATRLVERERVKSEDETLEEFDLFRGFVKADYNGDGIAEWRYVLMGGGSDPFLVNEEGEPDYAIISAIPAVNSVVGMSLATPTIPIQDLKTATTRQYLDSLYGANNPKVYVNTDANVSIDDLLNRRIHGIVRGRGPAQNAIQPLALVNVSREALEGIQLADTLRESRTGVTKYNQGLDADSLNKTATGITKIMTASQKRQMLMLRVIAETGVKELFKLVLKLVCKHQDQPRVVRLREQWVPFDPRMWSVDMDVKTDVGIGAGDKTETLQALQMFGQYLFGPAKMEGLVTRENVYEMGMMIAKAAKIQGADTKLITSPDKAPPKNDTPPQVMIEQQKMQMQGQMKQAEMQQNMQLKQMEMQYKAQADEMDRRQKGELELIRQRAQQETDANRQVMEAQMHQMKLEHEAQLNALKAQYDDQRHMREMEHQRWKAELDAATKIKVGDMNAKNHEHDEATEAATSELGREIQP